MVVFNWNALVLIMVLKMIGAVGGNINECCDAQHVQHVFTGCMVGTSEIEKGQDFHWATLKKAEEQIIRTLHRTNVRNIFCQISRMK